MGVPPVFLGLVHQNNRLHRAIQERTGGCNRVATEKHRLESDEAVIPMVPHSELGTVARTPPPWLSRSRQPRAADVLNRGHSKRDGDRAMGMKFSSRFALRANHAGVAASRSFRFLFFLLLCFTPCRSDDAAYREGAFAQLRRFGVHPASEDRSRPVSALALLRCNLRGNPEASPCGHDRRLCVVCRLDQKTKVWSFLCSAWAVGPPGNQGKPQSRIFYSQSGSGMVE
jgi:hypothetical protein